MTPNRSDFGSTFVQKLMKFFLYFQWSSNFYNSQETCLKHPGIFSCTFLTRLDFHLRHSTQECRQKLRKFCMSLINQMQSLRKFSFCFFSKIFSVFLPHVKNVYLRKILNFRSRFSPCTCKMFGGQ